MLINFSITNFKAYRNLTEFSMLAGKFRHFKESLLDLPGCKNGKVLPFSAIYGGNASGKTTFLNALATLQGIIIHNKPELAEPFMLEATQINKPICFEICFSSEGKIWQYSLTICNKTITHESLYDVTTKTEKCIFMRNAENNFIIGSTVFNSKDTENRTYAQKMLQSLPGSKIFLTTIFEFRVPKLYKLITPCILWFTNTLCIISADSRRACLGVDLFANRSRYAEALSQADTGVESLTHTKIDIPDHIPANQIEDFKKSKHNVLFLPGEPSIILIKDEGQKIQALRVESTYNAGTIDQVSFPLSKESDGTRRYLHLLPILLDEENDKTYIIDELDRSLHTLLSTNFIKQFRSLVSNQHKKLQLIFTTHDVMLIDKNLLRPDEIWLSERDDKHIAQLRAFTDYNEVRTDLNLRNSYLEGRMGGLPNII